MSDNLTSIKKWEIILSQINTASQAINESDHIDVNLNVKRKNRVVRLINRFLNYIIKVDHSRQVKHNTSILYLIMICLLDINHIREKENNIYNKIKDINDKLKTIDIAFDKRGDEINQIYDWMNQLIDENRMNIKGTLNETRENTRQIRMLISNLKTRLSEYEILLKELSNDQHVQKSTRSIINEKEKKTSTDELFGSTYLFIENMFRGTDKDILKRQSIYLPAIQKAAKEANSKILDLGCGRGEWIELLQQNDFHSKGVDINNTLINLCMQKKLDVVQEDIIEYLKMIERESLGGITCFQVIEHLPFNEIILLIKHASRALLPGGVLIIETPNPENILVSAYTFHFDPTHIKPVPATLLKYTFEEEGFIDVDIHYLHPYDKNEMIKDDSLEIAQRFNKYFYGPQDYAVIGHKPLEIIDNESAREIDEGES